MKYTSTENNKKKNHDLCGTGTACNFRLSHLKHTYLCGKISVLYDKSVKLSACVMFRMLYPTQFGYAKTIKKGDFPPFCLLLAHYYRQLAQYADKSNSFQTSTTYKLQIFESIKNLRRFV